MTIPRVELKPVTSAGPVKRWLRRTFARSAPRARVIAPASVHLGEPLEVEWTLVHNAPELTLVKVTFVGTEVARQRFSARTGIHVTTETHAFHARELDRQAPEKGTQGASGRGSVVVPASAVPSLVGKLNEIAWAVVVEASFNDETILREEFPVVVRAGSR
jgi:hypothetical protein